MEKTDSYRDQQLRQHCLCLIFGALIILAYFSRLFFPEPAFISTPDFGHSDVWHLNLPLKKIYWDSLRKGQIPFWEQKIGNGFPVLAENQIGFFNLQNLIVFSFLPFVAAFNLSLVLNFLIFFGGAYFLFIEFKIGKILSLAGALALTFSGFMVTHLTHHNFIHTISYFPLIFLFLERWLRYGKRRDLIFFIFFQTQMFFAGFQQLFLITNFFLFLYLFFTRPKPREIKLSYDIAIFIASLVIVLVLCLPQILPSLTFSRATMRSFGLTEDILTKLPFNPILFLTFMTPYLFGNPARGTFAVMSDDWPNYWEAIFYVGFLIFIIYLVAITSLIFGKKLVGARKAKAILFAGLICLLWGFGKYTPAFIFLQIYPFNMFRVPARYIFGFMVSVVFICLIFLERILKQKATQPFAFVVKINFLLVVLIELLGAFWNYHLFLPSAQVLSPPEIVKYLKKDDLIYAFRFEKNWNTVFAHGWQEKKLVEDYLFLKNAVDENLSYLWGLNNYKAYASANVYLHFLTETAIDELLDQRRKNSVISLRQQDFDIFKKFGITVLTSPYEIKGEGVKKAIKFQREKLKIFAVFLKNKNFIYSVPRVVKQMPYVTNLDLMKTPVETAIIPGGKRQTFPNGRCSEIIVDIKKNGEIIISHRCRERTFVIVNTTFYEGNRIVVNGKEEKAETANISQTGVWLDKF